MPTFLSYTFSSKWSSKSYDKATPHSNCIVQCMVFGLWNFQMVSHLCSDSIMFGLVSSLHLCDCSWPCHTEIPSKWTPTFHYFMTPSRPISQLRYALHRPKTKQCTVLAHIPFPPGPHDLKQLYINCTCHVGSNVACVWVGKDVE